MPRFKAFISYKHLASTRFAEKLELAIKAYAKPLLRPPIAIFRDEKYLRPAADLPSMIREALAQSEYFIYLASPEAANSPWVQSELQEWCADDARLRRLIIVLTAGRIVTDTATRGVNWTETDAIPRFLAARLTSIPLYVDLSWATTEAQQTVHDPGYKKAINSIVAALRDVDPIELSGQEILQHRRNLRLRNSALGLIGGLAVLLGVAAWSAWNQSRVATQQRGIAESRARDRTSQQLATDVMRIAEDRPDTALLLALNAYLLNDNAAVRSAWWKLLGARPLTASYLPSRASGLRFAPDGSLTLDDSRPHVFEQQGGRWVESAGQVATRPFSDTPAWTWSGGCDQDDCSEHDAGFWECAQYESRIIGSHGDQDNFCISSKLHVDEWCGPATFEVPGHEVSLEREDIWLRVRTNKGTALYACENKAPIVIAGDPAFFPPTRTLQAVRASGGSPARQLSISFDRRWLAVARAEGNVEIWPIIEEGTQQARRGATVLGLPASAEAVATSASGALAVALAGVPGQRGEIAFWEDYRKALAGASADRTIGDAWRRRGDRGVLVLSADGRHLAAGADVEIRLFETSSGRTLAKPYIGRNVATAAQLSADGGYLLLVPRPLDGALNSGAMLFGRAASHEPIRVVGRQISAVAFHPVLADTLITAGAEGVQVWPPPWRTPERKLVGDAIERLAVDAQHRLLAAGLNDRRVLVQDMDRNGAPKLSGIREHSATGLAFLSPPTAILWASQGGLETWNWVKDEWSVVDPVAHRDVQPLPDSYAVALTGSRAVIYDLSPQRWVGLTCEVVRRNLSAEEWRKFVGADFPYECACREYPPGEGSDLKSCS